MRWFKHMTDMLDDTFVVKLMDQYGLEGYGFWVGILELYAKYAKDNCGDWVEIPGTILEQKLRIRRAKVQKLLNFCSESGKFEHRLSWISLELKIPKMASLKDEYGRKKTKKSGQAPDKGAAKNKEELPNGNSKKADTPPSEAQSPVHPIWGDAVAMLVAAGEKEQTARSFLGRCLNEYGEGALNEAISACILKNPVSPKPYLMECLQKAGRKPKHNLKPAQEYKQYGKVSF